MNNNKKKSRSGKLRLTRVALLAAMLSSAVSAQEPDSSANEENPHAEAAPAEMEIFTGPKAKNMAPGQYPQAQRQRGNEGWVEVNFMIDPAGKPYEITVTNSTGDVEFEKAAIRTVDTWEFAPASLNGVPIDAGYTAKLVFSLTGGEPGAKAEFVRLYKQLMAAINDKDRDRADRALAKLEITNLYEDAYAALARFYYARVWGTEREQLSALTRAVAGENKARYLPKELYPAALQALLPLQLRAQDFSSSLWTWTALQNTDIDRSELDRWRPVMKDVAALRRDARTYSVSGTISTGTSWHYRLYKNHFKVATRSGRLSEIKLRCDKQYIFFRYDPDIRYEISDKYGMCAIEIVGDPGTQFELVQS